LSSGLVLTVNSI